MPFKTVLNPGAYHGTNKKPPFFEGWYFKMVSADEKNKIAIIPGVIQGAEAHAFIQVLNGTDGSTAYHTFPAEEFTFTRAQFSLGIANNSFDGKSLALDLDSTSGSIHGEIRFGPLTPWPVTMLSPGIMGWYAWVPKMECYHGVLSFNHSLDGTLVLDGKTMDFNNGRGYIEKDWGQAFPAAWIWFQSNHFQGMPACITASVAIIPWLGNSFRGFIAGLWLDGKLYRFATYNGSKIESLDISDDRVHWVLRNSRSRLVMTAQRVEGGNLRGPTRLDMGKRVMETLSATVQVELKTLQGGLIFEGSGKHAGLEVIGDLPRLLKG